MYFEVLFLFSILFLSSCENQEIKNNKSDVSKEMAIQIAKVYFNKIKLSNSNISKITVEVLKTIKDVSVLKTENQDNALYVINYNEGGFILISADNRISPVLAFSETDNFKSDLNELPPPVADWLQNEIDWVKYVKDQENLIQSEPIKADWDFASNKAVPPPPGPAPCDDIVIQKGPLLTTNWDQGCSYNNLLSDCSNVNSCNKVYTGCVATAMAQVMKYWHKPNSYNWNNMPNLYGTIDTQHLMKDVGASVNMSYGCSSSEATNQSIVPAFMYQLGYNATRTQDFLSNYNTIVQNIDWNRPVILTGASKRSGLTWPWNYEYNGHCWVCDGYISYTIFERDDMNNCTGGGWGYLFFHMNWGWGGYLNSWFAFNNFNPGTSTFNYNREIIYNITPK